MATTFRYGILDFCIDFSSECRNSKKHAAEEDVIGKSVCLCEELHRGGLGELQGEGSRSGGVRLKTPFLNENGALQV